MDVIKCYFVNLGVRYEGYEGIGYRLLLLLLAVTFKIIAITTLFAKFAIISSSIGFQWTQLQKLALLSSPFDPSYFDENVLPFVNLSYCTI